MLIPLIAAGLAFAIQTTSSPARSIVFVCEHGAAK